MWSCFRCSNPVDDRLEVCPRCGTTSDGRVDEHFVPAAAAPPPAAEPPLPSAEPPAAPAVEGLAPAAVTEAPAPAPPPFADFGEYVEEAETGPSPAPARTPVVPVPPEPVPVEAAAPPAAITPTAPAPVATAAPTAPAGPPPGMSAYEYLRQLESELSTLMDDHDTPDWKVNPAYHPDVLAFIRTHGNNAAFVQKAEALQKNRAKFYATIRQQAAAKAAAVAEMAAVTAAPAAPVPAAAEAAPKPRSVRRFLRRVAIGSFLLLLFAGATAAGGLFLYQQFAADRLRQVIEQTDAADAGWKLQDIVAKLPSPPDAENSAVVVLAAEKELPPDWRAGRVFDVLQQATPHQALSEEDGGELQAELAAVDDALAAARKLTGLKPGRYPPDPNRPIKIQKLVDLLTMDAGAAADRQDGGAALGSLAALLGIGASLADEPGLPAQFMRSGIRSTVSPAVERVLAQCPHTPAADLAQLRKLLEEEADRPILLNVLRGERAFEFELFNQKLAGAPTDPSREPGVLESLSRSVELWASQGWLLENQATDLELMDELVALARLPADEQYAKFREWQTKLAALNGATMAWRTSLAYEHLVEVERMVVNHFTRLAELRCAVVLLAAEEYRVTHGDWPANLEALVPDVLAKVPLSPFDGKPLRLQRVTDGLTVAATDSDEAKVSFRLWDEGWRREPVVR